MNVNTSQSPAAVVIAAFGGVRATARILDIDPSAVSRWQRSGHIPVQHQRRILEIAADQHIWLTAQDIIFGRPGRG